jgi:hypothetical protein
MVITDETIWKLTEAKSVLPRRPILSNMSHEEIRTYKFNLGFTNVY